jgi:hypothetical protein
MSARRTTRVADLDIFRSDLSWFGAEARMVGGSIVLIRGRAFAGAHVGRCGLPFALQISLSYEPVDEIAFPSPAQYERIREFERRVIDPLEADESGLLTFVHTGLGSVRYLIYLKDGGATFARLRQSVRDEDDAYYASADDPDWEFYCEKMQPIGDPSNGAPE